MRVWTVRAEVEKEQRMSEEVEKKGVDTTCVEVDSQDPGCKTPCVRTEDVWAKTWCCLGALLHTGQHLHSIFLARRETAGSQRAALFLVSTELREAAATAL